MSKKALMLATIDLGMGAMKELEKNSPFQTADEIQWPDEMLSCSSCGGQLPTSQAVYVNGAKEPYCEPCADED